jgi:signal transduction histidine kinase
MALTLAILAGTILLASGQLRRNVRGQMARRDAEVLHAVAQMLQLEVAADLESAADIEDPVHQLTVLFKTSNLGSVLGARLFDGRGRFVQAFQVVPETLDRAVMTAMQRLQPASRFHPGARWDAVFLPDPQGRLDPERVVPLLEVNVPLTSADGRRLAGVAQFVMEGQSLAAEFAQLDRHLIWQASVAFAVGGLILVLSIRWAFRRLQQVNAQLARRTDDLMLANQELALSAKTSAIGAVTAHLIHGLRNPLSGLQNFVTSVSAGDSPQRVAEREQAVASTRRMQSLINQVVGVLREEQTGRCYQLTLPELVGCVVRRIQPLAGERRVQFVASAHGEAILPNRSAQLVALILTNLAENAVEATPPGKTVALTLEVRNGRVRCEVRDEGAGIPESLQAGLFQPCVSTKQSGSGIGLALCRQLAHHLGATVELMRSSGDGSVFALTLPPEPTPAEPTAATLTVSG